MRKNIWDDEVFQDIEEMKKLVEPRLAKAAEKVAMTIFYNPLLTKVQIRERSSTRKQNVSHCLLRLLELGFIKRESSGRRADPYRYLYNVP